MILQCPECNARFMVADAQIPPQGRVVKCGRCAHQWEVMPPPPPETAAAPDPDDWDPLAMAAEMQPPASEIQPEAPAEMSAAETSFAAQLSAADAQETPDPETHDDAVVAQVPSLAPWAITRVPFMIATPLFALLWAVFALVAHYDAWAHTPVLEKIYAAAGVKPTDGLAFDDLVMQREEHDGKTNFILAGSITNKSSSDRLVPTVRVTLLDAKGKLLWSRDYVVKETLKGGDVYPFRITNIDTTLGGAVASILVDVGNPLQLALR